MKRNEFKDKYYTKKTYLGDGLYARFDGCYFILSTERENGEHWVGLEEDVINALMEYRKNFYMDAESIKD
jgi:hypothetical protein